MCLLFFRPASAPVITDEWLIDFYTRNQDGYGVMFSKDNVLHIEKAIGTVKDWIAFYREHEGKDAFFHLRMKTHGEIDLENTHPYPVFGFEAEHIMPLAMMHNGILSTGNDKDKSRSDTWHYIRDYLHPILDAHPDVLFVPEFQAMLGSHIGSNRFAFMAFDGRYVIINKHQGVEWNGLWMSNTYAWSAVKALPPTPNAYSAIRPWKDTWQTSWNTTKAAKTRAPVKTQKPTQVGKLRGRKPEQQNLPLVTPIGNAKEVVAMHEDVEWFLGNRPEIAHVTYLLLDRLIKEFGLMDAWAWVDALTSCLVNTTKFIDGLKDPRVVRDWLVTADNNGANYYAY